MSTPKQTTDETAAEMKERLEQLDEDIAAAKYEIDDLEHKHDTAPRFSDSGDEPEEDDQTASPA